MKKILSMISVFIIMILLISCSAKEEKTMNRNTVTSAEKPSEPTAMPSPTGVSKTPASSPTKAPAKAPTAEPTKEPAEEPTSELTPTVKPAGETASKDRKIAALTFDDGPNVDTTPLVLDKLEKHGVVASFFLIGKYITEQTRPIMERELKLGCEINNHSWNHAYMNTLTPEKIKEEIQKTSDMINKTVGVAPAFFRPPYIAVNNDMYENIDLPFICGINCMAWDSSVTAKQRAEKILNSVQDGDIILLHDFSGNTNTVDALDTIIRGLLDQGYELVTVSKLFELKGVDPNQEYQIWSNAK